ncbi:LysR family transcriptional regulator [Orrella sp. NBD-18]|uniref:LysR family transcriptional regulator n=2 Tax=Sheuella amnicola TaxID=2707330 RepID=A0A6B2R4D1_9BURK|nr:LysR family transcriptional regulator [Sheuella amnicola]
MNLKQLEHLLALADTGSFSQAANQVHLTQPALSRSIQQLEQDLEARLIDRNGRRNELTNLGHIVAERARHLILEAEEIRRIVQHMQTGLMGPLSVGLGSGPASILSTRLMRYVNQHHPDMTLTITRGPVEQQIQRLRERSLDALVVDLRSVVPSTDLKIEALNQMRGALIARASHPLFKKRQKDFNLSTILKYPLATTKLTDEVIRRFVNRYGAEIDIAGAVKLRCEEIDNLLQTVKECDAVYFGVAAAARDALSNGSLKELSVTPSLDFGATFGIITLKARTETTGIEIFKNFVRETLKD